MTLEKLKEMMPRCFEGGWMKYEVLLAAFVEDTKAGLAVTAGMQKVIDALTMINKEMRNTVAVLTEEVVKRNEQIHHLKDAKMYWWKVAGKNLLRANELEKRLILAGNKVTEEMKAAIARAPLPDELVAAHNNLVAAGYHDEANILYTTWRALERATGDAK